MTQRHSMPLGTPTRPTGAKSTAWATKTRKQKKYRFFFLFLSYKNKLGVPTLKQNLLLRALLLHLMSKRQTTLIRSGGTLAAATQVSIPASRKLRLLGHENLHLLFVWLWHFPLPSSSFSLKKPLASFLTLPGSFRGLGGLWSGRGGGFATGRLGFSTCTWLEEKFKKINI